MISEKSDSSASSSHVQPIELRTRQKVIISCICTKKREENNLLKIIV